MKRMLEAVLLTVVLATPAGALTERQLGAVAVEPPPNARLPLGLKTTAADGRRLSLADAIAGKPAVFIFADYRCRYLCGPAMALTANALAHTPLTPGADYRLVVLGLDPRDTAADAAAFERERLASEPKIAAAAQMLVAAPPEIAAAARALGYRYAFDAAHDTYAHLASAFVLAPDGKLVRALSEIQLQGPELEAALRAAKEGEPPPSFAQRLHCLCYPFDPTHGAYNDRVEAALRLGGVATLAIGAAGAAWAIRRRRPA